MKSLITLRSLLTASLCVGYLTIPEETLRNAFHMFCYDPPLTANTSWDSYKPVRIGKSNHACPSLHFFHVEWHAQMSKLNTISVFSCISVLHSKGLTDMKLNIKNTAVFVLVRQFLKQSRMWIYLGFTHFTLTSQLDILLSHVNKYKK